MPSWKAVEAMEAEEFFCGEYCFSYVSTIVTLNFCSEKQNGCLVKGKTLLLLLLIDSWKRLERDAKDYKKSV